MSGGGVLWNGKNAPNNTFSTLKAMPMHTSTISRVATVPRRLPNAGSTPYQRSYVTPDVKAVDGMPQQLHPEPTPYSGMTRRPDAANNHYT